MWHSEKKKYTCPKCGRTRILKTNSRNEMCPFCDRYAMKKGNSDDQGIGDRKLTTPIHLWTNHEGLTLLYNRNSDGYGTLLEDGKLVCTINMDFWFRIHSYTPEKALASINSPSLQKELGLLVKQTYSSRDAYTRHVEAISDSRDLSLKNSTILALYENGMNVTAISLKLNIPFSEVFDCINNVPRIHNKSKDGRSSKK